MTLTQKTVINIFSDNCKSISNPGQEDGDNDGIGDVCDGPVTAGNRVVAWGSNFSGQVTGVTDKFGSGAPFNELSPNLVAGLPNVDVIDIAAGNKFSSALMIDGTVWAWGRNDNGNLGNGTTESKNQIGPSQVLGVGGNGFLTLALGANGEVYSWGTNGTGEMGVDPAVVPGSAVPVLVPGLPKIKSIAGGGECWSRAVAEDGTVWAWPNDAGFAPKQVSGLLGVTEVAGNPFSGHTLAR